MKYNKFKNLKKTNKKIDDLVQPKNKYNKNYIKRVFNNKLNKKIKKISF